MDRSMIYLGSAITLFAIGQIVLAIVFYGKAGSASLTNLGWQPGLVGKESEIERLR